MSLESDLNKIAIRSKRLESVRYCRSVARRIVLELEAMEEFDSALNATRILQAMTLKEREMLAEEGKQ